MTSSNPAFSNQTFNRFQQVYGATASPSTVMTVQGTMGKTFGLLAILSATAIWSWTATGSQQIQMAVLPAALIGGFVLALITIFKPNASPWTAPVYAAFEGVGLGMLSYLIEHMGIRGAYPGIALQAVAMTCGVMFVMLFVYMTGLIKVTNKLRIGITAAVGAVCLVYMVSMVVGFFGGHVAFIDSASPLGIAFSFVVVGIASFKLLLDFDRIEILSRSSAPKYMEWYGAFGLILTLVWLYLEILDLLRKLNRR